MQIQQPYLVQLLVPFPPWSSTRQRRQGYADAASTPNTSLPLPSSVSAAPRPATPLPPARQAAPPASGSIEKHMGRLAVLESPLRRELEAMTTEHASGNWDP
ncbi:hypothetical protein B0H13DRAFT_2326918 [Mycena leptocephala]|nr:hypothetical protein B0H13DRAFT_2326918 [Mycena leptocephala]